MDRERIAFNNLAKELKTAYLERGELVDQVLACLVSGKHIFLLGPPGTAKSSLLKAVCNSMEDSRYFSWLLTRYTTPEELFGPPSIEGLKNDRFERVTKGKLPEADLAFIDEIWKASSSIINTLLTIMNEREFYNNGGGKPMQCPLKFLAAASNEMPADDELQAMYDRFLVRTVVQPVVSESATRALLTQDDPQKMIKEKITAKILKKAMDTASKVNVLDDTVDTVIKIRKTLKADEGIVASDRRWKEIFSFLKAVAWLSGDDEVIPEHLSATVDCLWEQPDQRNTVASVVGKISSPAVAEARELLDAAKDEAKKALEAANNSDAGNNPEMLSQLGKANSRLDKSVKQVQALYNKTKSKASMEKIKAISEELSGLCNEVKETARKTLKI